MTALTRDLRPDDLPAVLAMNNEAVPAVNDLDEMSLAALVALSHRAVVVVDDSDEGMPLGFALALLPGAPYDSENYRWFSNRSTSFLYVDRIVVADGARGRRLGQVLYDDLFDAARASNSAEVFCEVNLEPPNPGSLVFHTRLGFEQLGSQATKGGRVVVSLLSRPV
ncbi:GNAT family N-acetyltransferase [Subtercola boreus]|nr:GNAT family N-acetyltransferase [Subtercola boreus]